MNVMSIRSNLQLRGPMRSACCLAAVALLSGCGSSGAPDSAQDGAQPPRAQIRFVDRAEAAGLRFRHANGMTGAFLEAEMYLPFLEVTVDNEDISLERFNMEDNRRP